MEEEKKLEQNTEQTTENKQVSYGLVTNSEYLPGQKDQPLARLRPRVCIVGFAPSSMEDVREYFNNPLYEIWAINQLYISFPDIVPHVTRWFQIHHWNTYETALRDHSHKEWLAKQNTFPIYMQKKEPDIPMSIPYPTELMVEEFGRYFTNSISWEFALAIYERFEEIRVYGVDMAQDDEYCLDKSVKVLRSDLNWVEAGSIKENDELIGFDEEVGPKMEGDNNFRQWRNATVEKAKVIKQPCYRIHFADGTQVISSKDHKWLTYGEHQMRWKRTDELITSAHREGRPTKVVKVLDVWEEDKSYDAGFLSAAFDGEGYLTQNEHSHCNGHGLRLGFSQNENLMAERFRQALMKTGFNCTETEGNNAIRIFNIKGGRPEIMRFLGQIRPPRLLDKFNPEYLGNMQRKNAVSVESLEYLGEQEVIALKTSTKTFVAEGFASHNSEQRPSCEYFLGIIRGIDRAHKIINQSISDPTQRLPGMKLFVPAKSDLLKTAWLYPFEDDNPLKMKFEARRKELRSRLNQAAHREQEAHDSRMQLAGALDNVIYVQRAWMNQYNRMKVEGFKQYGDDE